MDIENFIAEFKKTFVYDLLSMTLKDEQLFEHMVDGDAVLWFKEQTRQMWLMWEKAKAQAVPEKTVKLHLVWNENKDECVGFLDSKDARYTATGDDRGMFGVTALGDYFRDLNDECNEFETQIVMIEAQEQKG